MATLGEISDAINQIEIKKQNLHKSFLDLQSQSQSSFNSTLKWTDFDSYFTTLTSSLRHKFHLLQTLNPSSSSSNNIESQLKSFCHNSDGLGLRTFIIEARNRNLVLAHLPDAYRSSPNAAAIVLDAMEGFCNCKGPESRSVRNACLIMLEGLMRVMPEIRVDLKNKAMKMAVQLNLERENRYIKVKIQYVFAFLRLVGAYGLIDGFSIDDVIDCFIYIANRQGVIDLCRRMFPADKMNDLIQELINKNKQVAAVKFIIKFQKTDEFSPVDILEERRLKSMRIVENISTKKGNKRKNAVIKNEVIILKSIIKCIDDYRLDSKYLKDAVVALVEKLQNEMGCEKRPATEEQQSKPKKAKVNDFLEAADAASVENSEQSD